MTALEGRRIVVTGASSGIGEAVARAVVAAGGAVGLLARREEVLTALADELGEAGVVCPGDVTDPDSVRAAMDRAVEGLGGIDGLVNSAGMVRPARIVDGDPADWQATFDVNVVGLLQVSQAAVPHLLEAAPADLVNISSMSGRRRASAEMTVYSASKFAVHVISDGLREELSDDGVRVTVLSPGYVRTPIFDDIADQPVGAQYRERAQERGLEPETVAQQVVFALSQPPDVSLVEIASTSTRQ